MAPCSGFPETATKLMVESLASSGERLAMLDKILGSREDEVQEDPICGWGNSVCPPRPSQSRGPNARRKAASKQPPHPDADSSNFTIRLVSEDFGVDHYRSAWKANVEPGTYRYIANNGYYRMAKFSSYGPDWVTVKRSRVTERAAVSSLDIKQAHKMLKKDLDSTFKLKPVIESSSHEAAAPTTSNAKEPRPGLSKAALVTESASMTSRAGASCYDSRRAENTLQRVDSAPNLGARLTAGSGSVKSEPLQDSAPQPRVRNDAFTVAPVARADTVLRPLEKLTPHQKRIDRRMSDPDRQAQQNLPTEPRSQLNTFGVSGNVKKTAPVDLSSAQLISQAESDILSRLRNGFHVSNRDDGKSVACSFLNNSAIRDYSRLLAEKVKAPLLGPANGTVKSLGTQRRGPALSKAPGGAQTAAAASGGSPLLVSDAIGAPASLSSGLNPTNDGDNWALPEISGKRIAVAATLHQRIL